MNKRFLMVYSMGKDSTLALQKMIGLGYEPVVLVVACRKGTDQTLMHRISVNKVQRFADSLNIPIELVYLQQNDDWASAMRNGIKLREKYDVDYLVTGDIDVQEHIDRTKRFSELTGLTLFMPLSGMTHEECLKEELENGYKCIISTLCNMKLPISLLGRELTYETVDIIKNCGCDVCGEDNSYHTLVVDSPMHRFPIQYRLEDVEIVEGLAARQKFDFD